MPAFCQICLGRKAGYSPWTTEFKQPRCMIGRQGSTLKAKSTSFQPRTRLNIAHVPWPSSSAILPCTNLGEIQNCWEQGIEHAQPHHNGRRLKARELAQTRRHGVRRYRNDRTMAPHVPERSIRHPRSEVTRPEAYRQTPFYCGDLSSVTVTESYEQDSGIRSRTRHALIGIKSVNSDFSATRL